MQGRRRRRSLRRLEAASADGACCITCRGGHPELAEGCASTAAAAQAAAAALP